MVDIGIGTSPLDGLADAFRLTAAPVVVVDRHGVLVSMNRPAAALFGVDEQALVGVSLEPMLTEGEALVPVWRAGGTRVVRRRVNGPGGAVFEIDAHSVAVEHDGDVIGASITLLAVDGANPLAVGKRAAIALQGEVLDALPMPVLIGQRGDIVYANAAAVTMFGVDTLDEVRERSRRRLHLHPRDHARVEARIAALSRGDLHDTSTEYRIVRPDGTERVADWHSLRVNFGGEDSRLYAAADVTDLAEMRDSLAELESFERQVLEALTEAVIVTDADGVCTLANEAAARLLRLEAAEQMVGAHADSVPLVDLLTGAAPVRARHPVWQALAGVDVPPTVYGVQFGRRRRRMRVTARPIERLGDDGPVGAVVTASDVTEELDAYERVVADEQRFRELARLSPVGIYETDPAGMCIYVNDAWTRFTGLDIEGCAGDGWVAAIHPDDRDAVATAWYRAATDQQRSFTMELRYRHVVTGTVTSALVTAAPLHHEDGAVRGWLGVAVDMTGEHALRSELQASERRFRELAERSPDVVLRVNLDPMRVDYASPSTTAILGRSPDDLYDDATLLVSMVHPDDRGEVIERGLGTHGGELGAVRIVHPDGTTRWVEARTNVVLDGSGRPTAWETTMRDVTESVLAAARLDELAHVDTLTGLLNRRALLTVLERRIASGAPTSVMFLDLDGFKAVNDAHGHDAGDAVLVAVADRVRSGIRRDDVVARFAGDEFVVVVDPAHDTTMAERILRDIGAPIGLSGGAVAAVGASIGLTRIAAGDDLGAVLRRADAAMYEVKRTGKGRVRVM